MPRPCTCERIPPAGEPYTTAYCRLCYLWHTSSVYRKRWEDAAPKAPCPHLKRRARDEAGKVKKKLCQTG